VVVVVRVYGIVVGYVPLDDEDIVVAVEDFVIL
jgi:hypothetical protein